MFRVFSRSRRVRLGLAFFFGFIVYVASSSSIVLPLRKGPAPLPFDGKRHLPAHRLPSLSQVVLINNREAIPLGGNITSWGEYFITVTLGTPPQKFNLQLDTGSTDLIVYSKGCQGCADDPSSFYDYTASSTAQAVPCASAEFRCDKKSCVKSWLGTPTCSFRDTYGDGSSVSGFVAQDVFSLGGGGPDDALSTKAEFGCIESVNTDSFEPMSVEGILGVADSSLSSWSGPSALQHIIHDHNLYNSFSMCLPASHGVFEVGANYSGDSRIQWTPIVLKAWFVIEMEDIQVNGKTLGVPKSVLNSNNGPIVDSGTTLVIVSSAVLRAFRSALQASCNGPQPLVGVCNTRSGQSLFNGMCYKMSREEVLRFPTLSFSFKNIPRLPLGPSEYLFEGTGLPGFFCLGLQAADGLPIILGDIFMQKYNTIHDMERGQIGFGPLSSCPTPSQA